MNKSEFDRHSENSCNYSKILRRNNKLIRYATYNLQQQQQPLHNNNDVTTIHIYQILNPFSTQHSCCYDVVVLIMLRESTGEFLIISNVRKQEIHGVDDRTKWSG
eukprot:TRINITY_DN6017_c0_g1_i1.p1 TRINITY_DN6017_c0_g1~~TRINITY_DN6017_c0_g1_i1.p1  ORF type:complete len:105 (+),score=10.75 TRINITY_DN6017_c0_g1_i1:144-458(+)